MGAAILAVKILVGVCTLEGSEQRLPIRSLEPKEVRMQMDCGPGVMPQVVTVPPRVRGELVVQTSDGSNFDRCCKLKPLRKKRGRE